MRGNVEVVRSGKRMIPSMKNFRAAVFTLKFGEVVLCDFYLRKNRVSDGLESSQIGIRGYQLGGDQRMMKMNRGTAEFTD